MLSGSEGLIVVMVVLLLFGGAQIPKLAKNLGLAQKELKNALSDDPAPTDTVASDGSASETSTDA
jgi:sec-independent protein translocase protein TatA